VSDAEYYRKKKHLGINEHLNGARSRISRDRGISSTPDPAPLGGGKRREEREREKENHFPILSRTVCTPKSTQYWQDGWPVLTRIPPRESSHNSRRLSPRRKSKSPSPKRANLPAQIPGFSAGSNPKVPTIKHNNKSSQRVANRPQPEGIRQTRPKREHQNHVTQLERSAPFFLPSA
jgi:hypothetical protein